MMTHRMANIETTFVRLRTAEGQEIAASPGHYIWASSLNEACSPAAMQPTQAIRIKAGSCVLVANNASSFAASKVIGRHMVMLPGLYNPHTASGSIIVDEIAALTFTNTLPPSVLVHSIVTMPGRAVFGFCKIIGAMPACSLANDAMLRMYHGSNALPMAANMIFGRS